MYIDFITLSFLDKVSCSSGWSQRCHVAKDNLETQIFLSTVITGLYKQAVIYVVLRIKPSACSTSLKYTVSPCHVF